MGIYGLVGESLTYSLSPAIHKKFFTKTGIDGTYNLFEVKRGELKEAVEGLKALGVKGVNVTIPYKVHIVKYLDDLSPEAQKIGAVNTIVFSGKKAVGYNTDYFGFGMALQKNNIKLKDRTALILGTGGAARAVFQYLLDHCIGEIIFVSSNPQNAMDRFKGFKVISYKELDLIEKMDILINCTPVGMHPDIDNSPIDIYHLKKFKVIFDLIYNPRETILLKNAQKVGAVTINGMYMLVCQAAKSQELWNKVSIDADTIDRVYEEINER